MLKRAAASQIGFLPSGTAAVPRRLTLRRDIHHPDVGKVVLPWEVQEASVRAWLHDAKRPSFSP